MAEITVMRTPAETGIAELFERLKGSNEFLAGSEISLADCFLAPIFAYLTMTPDAEGLLQPTPGLREWWEKMNERPSMQKTPPQF